MPQGKPAGVPCVHLDEQVRCRLFGQPQRPAVCGSLQPSAEMCGPSRTHALRWLSRLEDATLPQQGVDTTVGQRASLSACRRRFRRAKPLRVAR